MGVAACATLAAEPVTVMHPACPLSAPQDCTAAKDVAVAMARQTRCSMNSVCTRYSLLSRALKCKVCFAAYGAAPNRPSLYRNPSFATCVRFWDVASPTGVRFVHRELWRGATTQDLGEDPHRRATACSCWRGRSLRPMTRAASAHSWSAADSCVTPSSLHDFANISNAGDVEFITSKACAMGRLSR